MKLTLILMAAVTATLTLSAPQAMASEKKSCKVTTNDIGTITGRGPSSEAAFEDAATQCFERRAELFRLKRGTEVDEETGLLFIDVCANIKCS